MSNPFFDHPVLNSPYLYGSEARKYPPDFIVLADDGRPPRADGTPDFPHLVVEIKGYRREDAKEKKSTMDTYWVPGVNRLKTFVRRAFADFTDIYRIEFDFATKVKGAFDSMIAKVTMVSA